jgi:hypothetical protein
LVVPAVRSNATKTFPVKKGAARFGTSVLAPVGLSQHPQGRRQTHRPSRWRTAPGAQLPHLLGDLATLTRNVVRLGRDRLTAILATPTRTQHRALDLLGLTLTA